MIFIRSNYTKLKNGVLDRQTITKLLLVFPREILKIFCTVLLCQSLKVTVYTFSEGGSLSFAMFTYASHICFLEQSKSSFFIYISNLNHLYVYVCVVLDLISLWLCDQCECSYQNSCGLKKKKVLQLISLSLSSSDGTSHPGENTLEGQLKLVER